jgi:AcrR family transcriptional regulator
MTTKEVARAAGLSEAALYKYFRDKEELFLAVMGIRLRPFIGMVLELPDKAGSETVSERLRAIAGEAIAVYTDSGLLAMALFAEPALLARQRAALGSGGPHHANRMLSEYLRREQSLGRISAEASPAAAADLLLGACFQRAFFAAFVGDGALPQTEARFIEETVDAVLRTLV